MAPERQGTQASICQSVIGWGLSLEGKDSFPDSAKWGGCLWMKEVPWGRRQLGAHSSQQSSSRDLVHRPGKENLGGEPTASTTLIILPGNVPKCDNEHIFFFHASRYLMHLSNTLLLVNSQITQIFILSRPTRKFKWLNWETSGAIVNYFHCYFLHVLYRTFLFVYKLIGFF